MWLSGLVVFLCCSGLVVVCLGFVVAILGGCCLVE